MLDRYLELKKLIEKYSYYYYEKNESLISDKEFDELLVELENLEKTYPNLKKNYLLLKELEGLLIQNLLK